MQPNLHLVCISEAHPSELVGIRLSANFGSVEGDDNYIVNKGGDEVARLNRNLNFKSIYYQKPI